MVAFAAAESDLALRIRLTLRGGARRMGTLARGLAALLLGPLMVVTLPSYGTTGKRTGGDMAAEKVLEKESWDVEIWREAMTRDPAEWSEKLRLRLLWTIPDSTFQEMAMLRSLLRSSSKEVSAPDTVRSSRPRNSDHGVLGIGDTHKLDVTRRDNDYQQLITRRSLRQVGLVDQVTATERQTEASAAARKSEDNRVIQELKTRERERTWAQAEVIDQDEWSEELKAQLLKFNPGGTIEEIAKEIRKRRLWGKVLRTAAMTDPDEWSDELKTLLARWPDNTIEEIAKRVHKRPETAALYIVLDQDGSMKLNNRSVTFATLKEELQAKRQLLDNTEMITIQGDGRAMHGQIVQVMEIARQVGLVDQVIATAPQRTTE